MNTTDISKLYKEAYDSPEGFKSRPVGQPLDVLDTVTDEQLKAFGLNRAELEEQADYVRKALEDGDNIKLLAKGKSPSPNMPSNYLDPCIGGVGSGDGHAGINVFVKDDSLVLEAYAGDDFMAFQLDANAAGLLAEIILNELSTD